MVLVGHVTKEGDLAGPRVLEHLVDTVLAFDGDRHHSLRMLRARKHRHGATGELGLLEMTETGLVSLDDPSRVFIGDRRPVPGSVVAPVLAGERAMLVELQALLVPSAFAVPRRVTRGLDTARLDTVVAVLARRAGVDIGRSDIYASSLGGLRVVEPAADLGVLLAIASACDRAPGAGRSRRLRRGRPRGRGPPGHPLRPAPRRGRPPRVSGRHRARLHRRRALGNGADPGGHRERGGGPTRGSGRRPGCRGSIPGVGMVRTPMLEALSRVAPGSQLREGLDRVLQAHKGALIILGDGPEVLNICSGGFLLDAAFSPQRLSELAKMDGAIILAADVSRIARANVHLVPDPSVPTSETGTRHRTAERVARSLTVPVIAVSEGQRAISVYVGADKYPLRAPADVLDRANQGLQTLQRYRARLDRDAAELNTLEVEDVVALRDIVNHLQLTETMLRLAAEVELPHRRAGQRGQAGGAAAPRR